MGLKCRLLAVSSPFSKKAGTFVSKLGAEPHAPAAGRKICLPTEVERHKKAEMTAIWHIFTDLSPFYFNNSFRSSSGVVIGAIPKFSTR